MSVLWESEATGTLVLCALGVAGMFRTASGLTLLVFSREQTVGRVEAGHTLCQACLVF